MAAKPWRRAPTGVRGACGQLQFHELHGSKRLSGEHWLLGLRLGHAESPEDTCHCTFIFWGTHIKGEKTMKK